MINKIKLLIILCLSPLLLNAQKTYTGIASYYGKSLHGSKMASGERYNKNGYQCAHRTYPFGTMLKLTNPKNGKSVTVKVTDRGPKNRKWELDISWAAARDLGMLSDGILRLKIKVVKLGKTRKGKTTSKKSKDEEELQKETEEEKEDIPEAQEEKQQELGIQRDSTDSGVQVKL